jgi:dienelactone hydrolase
VFLDGEVFVVLLHSMFGLRDVEREAAERLRASGHQVTLPDLFAGDTADGTLDSGYAIMQRIGWPVIVARARRALEDVPADAALGGLSMGVGVIGELWPTRPEAAAVFCLHAPTVVPTGIPKGTPVQLHVAASDSKFSPPDQIVAFRRSAAANGAIASVHIYDGAGHLYTDRTLADFNQDASNSTWERVLAMLAPATRTPA